MPRGGKRKGAGRKPREDGRFLRMCRIAATVLEWISINKWTTPETRREIILAWIREQEAREAQDDA
jgi:hypothetical protein